VSEIDTSADAVDRLADRITGSAVAHNYPLAETPRALAAERDALRRGWLTTIQVENSCNATGASCLAKRCGCVEEMEMLLREDDARAALAGEPQP
jgi:glycine cleavage system H lipoate-binding protein